MTRFFEEPPEGRAADAVRHGEAEAAVGHTGGIEDARTQLERLISRFLDDESTADERRELKRQTDGDPVARGLFDEHVELDREVGRAMRVAMHRGLHIRRPAPLWYRVGRTLAVAAAAACMTILFWTPPQARNGKADVQRGSLFAAPAPFEISEVPPPDRPAITEKQWILVPTDRPSEFMVIEVNRIRQAPHGKRQPY